MVQTMIRCIWILLVTLATATAQVTKLSNGVGFNLNSSLYVTITSAPGNWIRLSLYNASKSDEYPNTAPYLSKTPVKPISISSDVSAAGVVTTTTRLAVDLSQQRSNWTLTDSDGDEASLRSDILADKTDGGDLRLILGRAGDIYGSHIPAGKASDAPTPLTRDGGTVNATEEESQLPTFWDDRGFRVFVVPSLLSWPDQVDSQNVRWHVNQDSMLEITCPGSQQIDVYFSVAKNIQNSVAQLWELTRSPSNLPPWAFGLVVSSDTWQSSAAVDKVIAGSRSGMTGLDMVVMNYRWFAQEDDASLGLNGSADRHDFQFNTEFFKTDAKDQLKKWHSNGVHVGGMRWPRLTNNASLATARASRCIAPASRTWNMTKAGCQAMLSNDLSTFVTAGMDMFDNSQLDANASTYLQTFEWANAQNDTLDAAVRSYGWSVGYVPGLQTFGYATTGSNVDSTWTGLQQAVSIMLHAQLVGQSHVAPMMGGDGVLNDDVLLVRTYQAAALMPFMRIHLSDADDKRLPSSVEDDDVRVLLEQAVQLRYWLLPALYSHHLQCIADPNNRRPLITPMAGVCLPADGQRCLGSVTQWVVADSLLFAPVLAADSKVDVLFPSYRSMWYQFNSTVTYNETRSKSFDLDIESMALFASMGSVIPVGCALAAHANEPSPEPLLIHVYTGVDATLTFIQDNGGRNASKTTASTDLTWFEDRQSLSWKTSGSLAKPQYKLIQAVAFFPDLDQPIYSNVRTFENTGFFSFQPAYLAAKAAQQA